MSSRETPACRTVGPWLRNTHGKQATAGLTGQDTRALHAFIHTVELYTCADNNGQKAAICAMRWLVNAMQPSMRWLARDAIVMEVDGSEADRLWAEIIVMVKP